MAKGSKYNGVGFKKTSIMPFMAKPWFISMRINGKPVPQQSFVTEKEAAIAADKLYIRAGLMHLVNILKPINK